MQGVLLLTISTLIVHWENARQTNKQPNNTINTVVQDNTNKNSDTNTKVDESIVKGFV